MIIATRFRALLIGGAIAAGCPVAANAQAVLHFMALSTPPSTVGTCMPDDSAAAHAREKPRVRRSRLLIRDRDVGERDMLAFVDDAGRLVQYAEQDVRSKSMGASEGDVVEAHPTTSGAMAGVLIHQTVAMDVSALTSGVPLDTALHDMQAKAKHMSSHSPLTAEQGRRARALAAWLLKRCPAA